MFLKQAGELILGSTPEDKNSPGLIETPERFSKAYKEILSGYHSSLEKVIGNGIFPAEGQGLIAVKEVEFYSLCEHHLLPFWGKMSVSYYPDKKIFGFSKISRIIDHFSKRLQIQERLTEQIATSIFEAIHPKAIAVRVYARHLCIMMRGAQKQGVETITQTGRNVEALSTVDQKQLYDSLASTTGSV